MYCRTLTVWALYKYAEILAGAWIDPIPLALKLNLSQGAAHWVAPADNIYYIYIYVVANERMYIDVGKLS